MFSYCLAKLIAILINNATLYSTFEVRIKTINNFMKKKRVQPYLRKRIINFCTTQWKYNKAMSLSSEKSNNIETAQTVNSNFEALVNTPLFYDLNLDFIHVLATGATNILLPPNEALFYNGTKVKTIYIIQEGYCLRYYGRYRAVLGPSSYFGCMSVLFNIPTLSSVKTLTHVKILCLDEELFWRTASIFVEVKKKLVQTFAEFDFAEELLALREKKESSVYFEKREWSNKNLQGTYL